MLRMRKFLLVVFLLFLLGCPKKGPVTPTEPPANPPENPQPVPQTQPIPTPQPPTQPVTLPAQLMELQETPLDIAPYCRNRSCFLLILFRNKLVQFDWMKNASHEIPFPDRYLVPARSPSGKIILDNARGICVVTTNALSEPLFFDQQWNGPFRFSCSDCRIPIAEPGFNFFRLADGQFFDFDSFDTGKIAVVDRKGRLSVAENNSVTTSDKQVGTSVAVSLPFVYTSSSTMRGENDSILIFRYTTGSLTFEASRNVDGEILTMSSTDLDQNGKKELLIALRKTDRISIETIEP